MCSDTDFRSHHHFRSRIWFTVAIHLRHSDMIAVSPFRPLPAVNLIPRLTYYSDLTTHIRS